MDKKNIIIIICICAIVALSTYIITINTIPQPNNNITNNITNNTTNNTTNITINKTTDNTQQTQTTKNVQKQDMEDKATYTEEEEFTKLDSNGRYINGQYQGSTPAEAQEYERREGNRM